MSTVAKTRRIEVRHLVEGSRLRHPIQDETGLVLLEADVEISDSFRDSLLQRGIHTVEVATGSNSGARSGSQVPEHTMPAKKRRMDRRGQTYDPERARQFARSVGDATDCVKRLGEKLTAFTADDFGENSIDADGVKALPEVFLDNLLADSDQALASASDYQSAVDFANRSSRLCILSMETAVEMDFSQHDVLRVGMGGLLHDIGLYCGPSKFRDPTAILSSDESWEYRKHPRVAERLLADVLECDAEMCRIVAQVHERMDGSGYPECLSGKRIHWAAKIIGIADAYLTLTAAGPGRPAMTPHDAMNYLLLESMRGSLDSDIVEAFVSNLCLFPINTRVVLRDGREATVARRNGDNCTAPYVATAPDEELIATDTPATTIRESVVNASTGQMRICNQIMAELDWSMIDTHPALNN